LLFAKSSKTRNAGDTLIFIDEIQNSPKAISLLRYFYEECPEFFVIAAGSLLENVIDIKASFPVGRVQYLSMHPCSFREFLSAIGKESLLPLMDTPELTVPLHNELMHQFNQYILVGGMPEAVALYSKTYDIIALDDVYAALLRSYKDDVEKYVRGNKLNEVVRFVLESGWRKAGETITLSNFSNSSYCSRDVGEAIRLLEKAMLVELVYPTTVTSAPIMPEHNRMPKLIWFDTGLVNYASGIRSDIIAVNDILDLWKGRIAEHIVAQELLALNNRIDVRRSFWVRGKGGDSAEIDFIYQKDSRVYPIEVKAGRNSHLRSIHSFINASNIDVGIRVWSGPYSIEQQYTTLLQKPFRLVNLPFYLVNRLDSVLWHRGRN